MMKPDIDYGIFHETVFKLKQTQPALRVNANDNKDIKVFLCGLCGNRTWKIGSNFCCFCSECNHAVTLTEIYEAGK